MPNFAMTPTDEGRDRCEPPRVDEFFRVGTHNPRNLYFINQAALDHKHDIHIGVMFTPEYGRLVASALNGLYCNTKSR